MHIFTKINDITQAEKNIVIALGTFDGIHIGHRSIISRAISLAEKIQGKSLVFTFSNHPLTVIAPDRAPLQIGDDLSKETVLSEMGVDFLVSIPFNRKFAQISAEDFLRMLRVNFAPKYIVVGPNFSFGYKGKGSPRMLLREGQYYGFKAEVVNAVQRDGHIVSSTYIRQLLEQGELERVNELLGRPFTFSGRVVHGDRRGRKLGFPTANLVISDKRAMLPNGAYAVRVRVQDNIYNGIASIGTNPTFAGFVRRLEVHILDFSGDIYDEPIQVYFVKKLREEQKFSSAENLIKQLNRDKKEANEILRKT